MSNVNEEKKLICKKKDGSDINVMIVDDSQFMRNQIKKIMEILDIKICCEAENGKIAVEKYQEFKPDLLTMDITMPDMNGVDALKKLKQINPNVKIIMITAVGHQDKVKECIISGAVNYIVKPFNSTQAKMKIFETVEKHF